MPTNDKGTSPSFMMDIRARLGNEALKGEYERSKLLAAEYDRVVAENVALKTAAGAVVTSAGALNTAAGALTTALAAEGAEIADCADEIAAVGEAVTACGTDVATLNALLS